MKHNQKGFSTVEILITVVIVVLLGTIGWLIYDRQNSKSDDNSAIQTSATQNEEYQRKQ